MKSICLLPALLLFTFSARSQSIRTGSYDELDIAYNPATQMITGYFESATGYDEGTDHPKFSCAFYLEGKVTGGKAKIRTYYPAQPLDDVIDGTLETGGDKTIKVHLAEEHGGCWNVQHFADEEPAVFTFDEAQPWIEIRYVKNTKAYFHDKPSATTTRKAFVVKGDVVRISKVQDGFALCSYNGGKQVTTGWLSLQDLNKPGGR
ncbi:hypothetical protein [Taibaiella koreensis]|uniref:hypothetical protein n=1 Tax=Taibaiella koreensis TaxID=1268548 RepID=UPI000E5A07B6|nr:hypothetical protein [Taibaiella koreensis]